MSLALERPLPLPRRTVRTRPTEEPAWVRRSLVGGVLLILALLVLLPLGTVLVEALREGWGALAAALTERDARAAIRLTLIVAAVAVPLNALFGVAAAWALTKFRWRGKALVLSLIDLPFSVSPVVAGLCFVLLFGANSAIGGWLVAHDWPIIFAVPGIVLATMFITFPFVARELVPLMTEQGTAEEEAALTLGASGWRMFVTVTLPNIRWALLYGVLLCNARAMGEFGAVSVVSGHIRGLTNTLPLHVEVLYNDYDSVGAFAAASVLAGLGILTLVLKTVLEWSHAAELSPGRKH